MQQSLWVCDRCGKKSTNGNDFVILNAHGKLDLDINVNSGTFVTMDLSIGGDGLKPSELCRKCTKELLNKFIQAIDKDIDLDGFFKHFDDITGLKHRD